MMDGNEAALNAYLSRQEKDEAEYEEANAEFIALIETAMNFAREQNLSDDDIIGAIQNGFDDCTSITITLRKSED